MIYIVEDDMSVRRSFEMFLDSAGLRFKSFGSAESFLREAGPTPDDLLLLDVNLPVMSGLELLHELAATKKEIPSIVITAVDDSFIRDTCRKFGVKAFLRKPVDGGTLIDLIKYHMH